MSSLLSRIYLKVIQSKIFSSLPHLKFFLIYLLDDPWSLSSEKETLRFTHGVTFLSNNLPKPSLLIDIGCGLGHHSKLLSQHSASYIGLDISHAAIKRARRKNPSLHFHQIDNLYTLHTLIPPQPDTVVTLFEVLYYVQDPQEFLFYLKKYYTTVFISYLLSPQTNLDYLFSSTHLQANSTICALPNQLHRFVFI